MDVGASLLGKWAFLTVAHLLPAATYWALLKFLRRTIHQQKKKDVSQRFRTHRRSEFRRHLHRGVTKLLFKERVFWCDGHLVQ